MIREALLSDAPAITDIYNYYVEYSSATMEYEAVQNNFFEQKITEINNSGHFWLVIELEERIIGYAYSRAWNPRDGYQHTCEVSIYIAPEIKIKGLGTKLYSVLFERLKKAGMLVIIAVIALPNEASIALHEKFGLKKVAHFPSMGIKFGKWINVGYWQLNFN